MKGGFLISLIILMILSLIGCHTVPRHLVKEEVVIIYYPEYPIPDPQPIGGPIPIYDPPTQPIRNPIVDNTPPRNLQSDNPDNGGSYGKRDPLQSEIDRKSGETKTYPPVRKPERNDRVQ